MLQVVAADENIALWVYDAGSKLAGLKKNQPTQRIPGDAEGTAASAREGFGQALQALQPLGDQGLPNASGPRSGRVSTVSKTLKGLLDERRETVIQHVLRKFNEEQSSAMFDHLSGNAVDLMHYQAALLAVVALPVLFRSADFKAFCGKHGLTMVGVARPLHEGRFFACPTPRSENGGLLWPFLHCVQANWEHARRGFTTADVEAWPKWAFAAVPAQEAKATIAGSMQHLLSPAGCGDTGRLAELLQFIAGFALGLPPSKTTRGFKPGAPPHWQDMLGNVGSAGHIDSAGLARKALLPLFFPMGFPVALEVHIGQGLLVEPTGPVVHVAVWAAGHGAHRFEPCALCERVKNPPAPTSETTRVRMLLLAGAREDMLCTELAPKRDVRHDDDAGDDDDDGEGDGESDTADDGEDDGEGDDEGETDKATWVRVRARDFDPDHGVWGSFQALLPWLPPGASAEQEGAKLGALLGQAAGAGTIDVRALFVAELLQVPGSTDVEGFDGLLTEAETVVAACAGRPAGALERGASRHRPGQRLLTDRLRLLRKGSSIHGQSGLVCVERLVAATAKLIAEMATPGSDLRQKLPSTAPMLEEPGAGNGEPAAELSRLSTGRVLGTWQGKPCKELITKLISDTLTMSATDAAEVGPHGAAAVLSVGQGANNECEKHSDEGRAIKPTFQPLICDETTLESIMKLGPGPEASAGEPQPRISARGAPEPKIIEWQQPHHSLWLILARGAPEPKLIK